MSLVVLDKVGKTFRGRTGAWEAVRGFSLDLAEGEFVCLLGTSGCGKTTVLNMVAGFEAPSAGRILLDGAPVRGPGAERGVVFQGHDSLYDWLSALDNIAFGLRLRGLGRRQRRERAAHFLGMVGLGGQGAKHPAELSGGMKQRIQIARALAADPRILLMDEPFGALDAMTRAALQAELTRIWADTQKTVLFITHDIEEAVALSTRVAVMTRGPGGTLKAVVPVDLPFPRDRTSDGFMAAFRQVHALIHAEILA
ncbi:ABC transporter ATP-binding protein [Dankookia rubra]|uniref:ABC transporter ATP-binding protein n=1 Tax=Dankookia rubra TaxID=1442381 RepID=UPI0019D55CFB|nr:ABC transporter ATP-binding protein [Dankookia rubra]